MKNGLFMEKIGEVNFGKFKTEIKATKKVKKYIENEGISFASILPNAWQFYEVELFESINKGNKPDKKFGKNFQIIYNRITESLGWNEKEGLKISGFEDAIKNREDIIFSGGTRLISRKNPKKEFIANYIVTKKG